MPSRSPQAKSRTIKTPETDDPASAGQIVSLGRLDGYLGFRMRRVHSILSRDFFAATREWNLREGMFSALELIAANPGISQVRVSEEIGLDRSAMVLVMDELEKRLWAQRQRCARDRRRHRLSITPAGSKVLDELFRCMEQAEERALAVLDARELAIVRRALDRVFVAYTTADIRPDALRTGDAPRRRAAVRKRTERR